MPESMATLQLLDEFRFALDDRPAKLGPSLERLLAFLAVRAWPSRYVIAGTLWPDHLDDSAMAALRTTVWRLQRHAPGVLDVGPRTLALSAWVHVDLHDCIAWAQAILRDPAAAADADLAPPTATAELLPGWCEDWLEPERQRLHQLYVHAVESAATELLTRGKPGLALATALSALATDPLRESTHRLVVCIHLAEGNVDAALRQYRACQHLLGAELGVVPSAALVNLVAPYL
jgi:DNA-binding SARP family transcriptional activator